MFSLVIFTACVIVAALGAPLQNSRRLIKTGEDVAPVWMTLEEIDALSVVSDNFMDVTDMLELEKFVPTVAIPSEPSFPNDVNTMIDLIDADLWWNNMLALEAFTTRHRNTQQGIVAANWILDQMRIYGLNTTLNVEYSLFSHTSINQPSTITKIRGCDPSVADEIVIIGGHEDSTSVDINYAPGADDDATGTAAVMEMFRIFALTNFCPRRSVEFHTYAGEEGGLIGSNAIAQNYLQAGKNVISMVQFDMTGYEAGGGRIALIQDYTSATLNTFLGKLLTTYVPDLPFVTNSRCGYGCSDHAAWNNRGYPAAFPFEAPFGDHNPLIHTPQDVNSRISKSYGYKSLKLAMSYLVEMSLF